METPEAAKKMNLVIIISCVVLCLAAVVYYRSAEALPFVFGVIAASALNVVKIWMLARAVKKAVGMDENKIRIYMQIQMLIRYLLTAALLAAAVLVPFISLYGAAAGVLTMQAAAFAARKANIKANDMQ
jgi:hypothetical protein